MFLSLVLINIVLAVLVKLYLKLTCGLCESSKHMVGKTVIVTGANTGIGYETAKDLAERGARVIIACRDETKGKEAVDKIIKATGTQQVIFKRLDLASFRSIHNFVEDVKNNEERLDVLVNNAGAIALGNHKTEDGLLIGMQTNHFGPFLLTCLLLPLLKTSAPSRIINVSSSLHTRSVLDLENLNMEKETDKTYNDFNVYALSKLCNILMAVELSRQLKDTKVTINCVNPGPVKTDIVKNIKNPVFRHGLTVIMNLFYKSPWEGAQTSIYAAVAPELEDVTGCYFSDCHQKNTSRLASDMELARKLWEKSEILVKLQQ